MNYRKYLLSVLKVGDYFDVDHDLLNTRIANDHTVDGRVEVAPEDVFLAMNARGALFAALEALELKSGSEVLIQAMTCCSVPNPIFWAGLQPIYVDIDPETLCMDPEDLESKISKKSKVLIIQHTFGNRANVEELVGIARKYGLIVIEDCAHTYAAHDEYGGVLGTYGDIALISFGFEKVLSTRVGGAVMTNSSTAEEIKSGLEERWSLMKRPSFLLVLFWLLNPLAWLILRKTGSRMDQFVNLLRRMGLPINGFYQSELMGGRVAPTAYPRKLPKVFADIINAEIVGMTHSSQDSEHMAQLVAYIDDKGFAAPFFNELSRVPLLLYPIFTSKAKQMVSDLRDGGVYVYSWYRPVVAPIMLGTSKYDYELGSCPQAERLSESIVSFRCSAVVSEDYVSKIKKVLDRYEV